MMMSAQKMQIGQMPVNTQDGSAVLLTNQVASIANVYFGLRSDQISDDLVEACMKEILNHHAGLTIADIKFAFERASIEKKDWFGLRKEEVMKPIREWANMRHKVVLRFGEHLEEQKKESESELEQLRFEEVSLCVYRESMREFNKLISETSINQNGLNTWKGTKFQASAIAAKYFAHQIEQEEKNFLWSKAKDEFQKRKRKAVQSKNDKKPFTGVLEGLSSGKQELWIFSEMIVIKSIQLGLEPKELER